MSKLVRDRRLDKGTGSKTNHCEALARDIQGKFSGLRSDGACVIAQSGYGRWVP